MITLSPILLLDSHWPSDPIVLPSGRCGWFGGRGDGRPDEGLAFGDGLMADLPQDLAHAYCAIQTYIQGPLHKLTPAAVREWWTARRIVLSNGTWDRWVSCEVVDIGPQIGARTHGRIWDCQRAVLEYLGLETDQFIRAAWGRDDWPLGPILGPFGWSIYPMNLKGLESLGLTPDGSVS